MALTIYRSFIFIKLFVTYLTRIALSKANNSIKPLTVYNLWCMTVTLECGYKHL